MTSTKDYCKNTIFLHLSIWKKIPFSSFGGKLEILSLRINEIPLIIKLNFLKQSTNYNFSDLKYSTTKDSGKISDQNQDFFILQTWICFIWHKNFAKNKQETEISKKFMWIALVFKWRIKPCFLFCSCYFHHDVVFLLLYIFGWGVGDSINRRKIYTTIFFLSVFLSSFF